MTTSSVARPDAGHLPRRGVAANVTALAASQAITWSLTLLWTLVVPRALGPAGMGLVVTALSATSILGLLLGLPTRDFVTREIAARPAGARGMVGSAMIFRAAMAPVFLAAVAVFAAVADLGTLGTTVLYLTTAATLFSLVAEPALAVFQAVERMEYLAYYEVLNKTCISLGGVTLALLGVKVLGLTVFGLAVAALSATVAVRWARRLVGVDLRPGARRVAAAARASVPYWTFGVFFMIYLWIDSVMLGLMTPAEVVGYYGVATKLFTTLMFVAVILATATLPRLVAAFEESWERLAVAARAPLELALVVSLPACVGAAMTAGDAVPLLFGASFRPAVPVLVILSLCLPAMYLNIMLNQVLVAAKRPLVWSAVMLGATVVNPAVNAVLIPLAQHRWQNGAIGAAASLLVTEMLIVLAGLWVVGRHVFTAGTAWRLLRAGAAATAMAAVMYASSALGAVPEAIVGLATFVGCALLLRVLSPDERVVARAAAARVLGRLGRRRRGGARA
ncbi:MAG: flippase [Mycobacteriales bacterium]